MQAYLLNAVFFSAALMLGALGCGFSEHAGGSGLGMEGTMACGALGGMIGMRALSGAAPLATAGGSVLAACLFGMLFSLMTAAVIRMGAERTLAGLGMTLLGTAAAAGGLKPSPETEFAGFRQAFMTEAAGLVVNSLVLPALLLCVIGCLALYRTRFGACLRAYGDRPGAAIGAGVSAAGIRCAGTLISGFAGGLAGWMLTLESGALRNGGAGAGGFGFLAMAVMILGKDKPPLLSAAALAAGLLCAVEGLGGIPFLRDAGLPAPVYRMIPFVFSLTVLALTGGFRRAGRDGGGTGSGEGSL